MRIYQDRQIHTETGSQPIKSQGSQSGPHTNPMPFNNVYYKTCYLAVCTVSSLNSLNNAFLELASQLKV